jgi:hypothetical protein
MEKAYCSEIEGLLNILPCPINTFNNSRSLENNCHISRTSSSTATTTQHPHIQLEISTIGSFCNGEQQLIMELRLV